MIRRANRFHGHHSVMKVRGSVAHGKVLSFRYAKNRGPNYRLAVVVSKKVASHAVTRNRIRRRIFELVRTQGRVNNTPLDLVIYVKTAEVAKLAHNELDSEIASLTKKALADTL